MYNAIKLGLALFMLGSSLGVNAAPRGANTADIVQGISVPGMVVDINPGGAGCNTGAHEVWEPSQGGCSDIEYQKTTARVVSVTAGLTTIEAGSGSTSFTAQVVTENGKVAPPGVLVKWLTSNGNLAVPQGVTDSNGQARNTLSGATAGSSTVTATAAQGGATATVTVKVSKPVINSFTVVAHFNKRQIANTIYIDGVYGYYWDTNVFSWSATNADRYVLQDNQGMVMYSGSGTSFSAGSMTRWWNMRPPSGLYYLIAYKGSQSTTRTLNATVLDNGCNGCGM
ncbi:Ig-like domain-containing protein [Pseudomonas sp. EMN2]|uniref:Ig-like domain-containing protein n=1 Tax=Pseudomonas sp. EMN2 TaxID=2615212 RepID=UPI00129B8AD7|nr:Ig-like domain-containing protein [Pseudomonas sp. EMN2]